MLMVPNPSINTDASDKAACAGYVRREAQRLNHSLSTSKTISLRQVPARRMPTLFLISTHKEEIDHVSNRTDDNYAAYY